jgi:hypothetical protein
VLTVEFTVFGIPCLGLNGGPHVKHSEAFSFQIATDNQEETDRYWNAIVGGAKDCDRVPAVAELEKYESLRARLDRAGPALQRRWSDGATPKRTVWEARSLAAHGRIHRSVPGCSWISR